MPEGPSIVIAKEELQQFVGKKILSASGSAALDMSRLKDNKIIDVRTWGKHLLLCFNGFTIRVHFLMFGKYFINSSKDIVPKLAMKFAGGKQLNFYTSAVKMIEEPLDEVYDWSADIMNEHWDMAAARKKMKEEAGKMIVDVLLDQNLFAGLGNIIKNEVLYRTKIHPRSITGALPAGKITALLKEVHKFAFEFLEWKRANKLSAHLEVYKMTKCKRDDAVIKKEYLGTTKRRTFFCDTCQVLYK